MKREEIKRQFDQLKDQHQKDKQKEQQKENKITKTSQEKKILQAVVKTLGNCHRININHTSDKDQKKKKNFMAPFCGWVSTASRLEPL